MKLFTRILGVRWLVFSSMLAGFIFCAVPGRAADYNTIQLNRALGLQQTQFVAVDGTIAMRIKCLRAASTGASLTVSGTSLIFTSNGSTPETPGLDDTGGTPGTIDMSQATANTFGEVADIINASTYWRCILVAARPSQACSTSAILTAVSANSTTIFNADGIALTMTTSVADWYGADIGPEWMTQEQLNCTDLLNRRATPLGASGAATWTCELLYATETATIAGGVITWYVYAVKSDHAGATEVLLWESPGGTTTAANALPILPKQAPLRAPPGWRIVVQAIGSNLTSAASTMQVHGLIYHQTP